MKIKFGICFVFFILLVLASSCGSSKKVTYFQSKENRKGEIIDLPSRRLDNIIRFKPNDILSITVNVPADALVASDYNLPLIPLANNENSTEAGVQQGVGRQSYLVKSDGTIDFPVLGDIQVEGKSQDELETYLKELLMEATLTEPPIVTVRLTNFKIYVAGEINRPGIVSIPVEKNYVNLFEVLSLAGDLTIYGKRDDITLIRQTTDGGYRRISLDISKEDIISSPYYFLQQNDEIYVPPVKAKTQSADISPMLNLTMGVITLTISIVTFVLMLTN